MATDRPGDGPLTREGAVLRVKRIAQFREELAALEEEGGVRLTPEQRRGLEDHLGRLTTDLAGRFGIDLTESARRMSWGMRLTALLGTVAVMAALVLLLHRIWGLLPGGVHIALLTLLPLGFLAGAAWSQRRSLDPYFTILLALVSGVAFVLGLNASAVVNNQSGSPHAILAWAIFALCVGYGLNARLLLVAGLVLVCVYGAALGQMLGGGWWAAWIERPLFMIPAAGVLYVMPVWFPRSDPHRFGGVFRACGAGAGLFALLIVSLTGHLCCLGITLATAETLAQLIGLGLAATVVYHGVRLGEGSVANIGAAAFVAFLFARLHAWCWDWMPKYAFFFMLGLIAIVLLVVFRRLQLRRPEGREA